MTIKKILIRDIRIHREVDTDPDLSWIGRYSMSDSCSKDEKAIERENPGRNEYSYFIAANKEYAQQDYDRMESYNNNQWCMLGIYAAAIIEIPDTRGFVQVQTIRSGGLWGIESNSSESYLKEIEAEEIEDLKDQLKALGIKWDDSIEVVREE